MKKKSVKQKKISKFLYWTPRILSILFLCFLAVFSLDVIEPGVSTGWIILGLFVQNIPVFILAIVLWISWKYEIVGGIVFNVAGMAFFMINFIGSVMQGFDTWYESLGVALIISVPALLIGILFMIGWYKKKK